MKILKKGVKTLVSLLLIHSILPGSTFAAEKERGIFDSLFGNDEPTPKRTQHTTPPSSQASQVPVVDQKLPPNHVAVVFHQSLPHILEKMERIERSIPIWDPQHSKNPMNFFDQKSHVLFDSGSFVQPLSRDWRVTLMYMDKEVEALKDLPDPNLAAKLAAIPIPKKLIKDELKKNSEMAKQKRLAFAKEKAARENTEVEQSGPVRRDLLEQEKKQRVVEEQVLVWQNQIQNLLPTWFYYMCNPDPTKLKQFEKDSSVLCRWWSGLSFEVLNSHKLPTLYNTLQTGNEIPKVISLLNDFLVESLYLRSLKAYHQLQPKYLDAETSFLTFKRTMRESLREDKALPQILGKKELFKKFEALMGNSIREKVIEFVMDALKQKTEDQFEADEIKAAVNETIDIALGVQADLVHAKASDEIESSDPDSALRRNLKKEVLSALRSSLYISLKEAMKGNKEDDSSVRLKASTKEPENELKKTITVDIEKIMDVLYERMGVPKPKPPSGGWRSMGGWLSTLPKNPAYILTIPVSDDYIEQGKIPSSDKPTSPKRPSVRIWTKKKQENPLADQGFLARRRGLCKQIQEMRNPTIHVRNPQVLISLPLNLRDFLKENRFSMEAYKIHQKKPKRDDFLFDLPRAFTFYPGIEPSHLINNLAQFFTLYVDIIDSRERTLQDVSQGDLSDYMNPTRPSRDFYRGRKVKLRDSFPCLEDPKAMKDWIAIEFFGPLGEKLQNVQELEIIKSELKGHVHLLNLLEEFASDTLVGQGPVQMPQFIQHAKEVLLFKVKCQAISGKSKLPEQKEHQTLQDSLFQEKVQKYPGATDALKRMEERSKKKGSPIYQQHMDDRTLLIKFFAEVFKVTLTECISEFCPSGVSPAETGAKMLEELQKLYPSPSKEGGEPNLLLSSSGALPLTSNSTENLLTLSLHIPAPLDHESGVGTKGAKTGGESPLR